MENFPLSDKESSIKSSPLQSIKSKKVILRMVAFLLLAFFLFYMFFSAPSNFPAETIQRIEKGSSLRSVSLQLKNEGIIRSRSVFEAFVIIFGREKNIISSDYFFEKKLPVYEVARRISEGEHHMPKIKVTIPEGFNKVQIADVFASKLVNFDKNKFISETQKMEGYLFPDTYLFLITNTESDVIKSMQANFEKKFAPLRPSIVSSKNSEREILTMASLVEGEAKGDIDREVVSGILWKRLSIGMPLQVDVAPQTYEMKGLPESPIGNPGLEAIKATISPKSSLYLYYLHDKKGVVHYARTFAEHRQNIVKYLK